MLVGRCRIGHAHTMQLLDHLPLRPLLLLLLLLLGWIVECRGFFQPAAARLSPPRLISVSLRRFGPPPRSSAASKKDEDTAAAAAAATTTTKGSTTRSDCSCFDLVIAKGPVEWNLVADLRYNEWIKDRYATPSREAFRLATLEICKERCAQGAIIVVAQDRCSLEWLGVGEASPIEIRAAWQLRREEAHTNATPSSTLEEEEEQDIVDLYITDVVTAAAHRRKGVARALMMTLEKHADRLWLHVTPDNVSARAFYESLGYHEYNTTNHAPTSAGSRRIDSEKLAETSGSIGQTLLWKNAK
jgi:GNAT superfamily N-acetyltransferase